MKEKRVVKKTKKSNKEIKKVRVVKKKAQAGKAGKTAQDKSTRLKLKENKGNVHGLIYTIVGSIVSWSSAVWLG